MEEKIEQTRIVYLPGRNAVLAGALLALFSFCGFWLDWVFDAAAGLLLLLLLAAAMDWRRLRKAAPLLGATRRLPVCVGRGLRFTVMHELQNAAGHTLRITLRETLPPGDTGEFVSPELIVPAGGAKPLEYSVCIGERGQYQTGGLWVRLRGRLGLVDAQWRLLPPAAVKVYPESIVARDELYDNFGQQITEKLKNIHKRGEGMEFDTLSPYQPGDDIRHIDWRSSARHRSLLVRRHQVEQHRDVMIILDCGRLMGTDAGRGTKLDRAVDSALMLSETALRRGDRCGFGVFDDRIRGYLPPQAGERARRTILEQVYDVHSDFRESNFALMFSTLQSRQRKRALIVVLSDLVDSATSDRFRTALASLAKRHVVVFAALRTPLLEEYVRAQTTDYGDVCRKAVSLRLQREREKTLHTLGHSGVRIIDVEPTALTAPLINEYIALRAGNLL